MARELRQGVPDRRGLPRAAFHARGEPFEPAALINSLLHAYPREVYLQVLTALNHAAQHPDLAEVYRDQFLQRITAAMAARVRSALDGTSDGQAKAFLARQAVLRTMRTVLTYRSTAPAFAGNLGLPVMDPETAGVVLVHLVAAGLRLAQATSTAMIGGVPEDLAMEMVANNLFCRNERADVLLARTRMLWTTYGNQIDLGKLHLRDRPLALLREATGLDLDDIAALTVAYHGYIRAHQPGQPAGVDAFAGIPIERPIIEAYLGLFASTPDELAAKLDACPGSWQMLPIQERPLLRVGDVILVLDEQYLIERATQGLYWFVHDHERDLDSKRGRPRWNNAHAAMVELRVEDQLRRQAPPLIGVAGKTFFTEEDLQAAFPGTMNTDAGIDYGDQVMLAEIVTTQVTVPTRENADVTALNKDIEKFFLHKAEQLDVTAANLLSDPQPANSPLTAPAPRILPVAIRGGQFPLNPVTRRHIEDALQQKGLLHYRSGAPITRIALLDLEELELCESLYESRGLTLPQLIAQ